MKKTICIFICLILLAMSVGVSGSEFTLGKKEITVTYNGEQIDFKDALPKNIDGFTMVPMRSVFEKAGCEVSFDEKTRKVTALKGEEKVELTIDIKEAYVTRNGETEQKELDIAPVILEGRTLVPVRFISESLGFIVKWNANYKEVVIIDTDMWKNKLEEKSIFSAVLFEDVTSNEFFAVKAPVSVDFSAFGLIENNVENKDDYKNEYNASVMLDKDDNMYIKGEFVYELLNALAPSEHAGMAKNKYLKISIPGAFTKLTGIKTEKSKTPWDAIVKAIDKDEYIYSTTVSNIDDLVNVLSAVSVSEGEKVMRENNILSLSDGVVYDFDKILQ